MKKDGEQIFDPKSEMVTAAAVTALVAAGKAGVDVVKYFHVDDTIIVAVLDSKHTSDTSDRYEVNFQITNVSIHGAYLEAMRMVTPEVDRFEVADMERKMGAAKVPVLNAVAHKGACTLAWYMQPNTARTFQLAFYLPAVPDPTEKPFGQVELDITRLHQQRPAKKTRVSFRLRYHRLS